MLFCLPVRMLQHPSGRFLFLSLCNTSVYRTHRVELVDKHGDVDAEMTARIKAGRFSMRYHLPEHMIKHLNCTCILWVIL